MRSKIAATKQIMSNPILGKTLEKATAERIHRRKRQALGETRGGDRTTDSDAS